MKFNFRDIMFRDSAVLLMFVGYAWMPNVTWVCSFECPMICVFFLKLTSHCTTFMKAKKVRMVDCICRIAVLPLEGDQSRNYIGNSNTTLNDGGISPDIASMKYRMRM